MNWTRTEPAEYGLLSPEQKDELSRLVIQHRLWLYSLKALFLAPIPDPKTASHPVFVLDIGCGPADWTRDFATKYPSCHVVGLDLNPPSAPTAAFPSNVEFRQGNAEDLSVLKSCLPPDSDGFSFVFGRCLTLGIHDWPAHLARCYSVLAPGGWLESQDTMMYFESDDVPSDCPPEDNPIMSFMQNLRIAVDTLGFESSVAKPGKLTNAFKAAGFINLQEKANISWVFGGSEKYPWPAGWQSEMASFGLETYLGFFRGTGERMLPAVPGLGKNKSSQILQDVENELLSGKSKRYRAAFAGRYAQKPVN